jgi:hypothetical protein
MKASKWLVGIPTLVCAMLFLSSAFADVVPVANPSFETLPGGGLPMPCGTNCQFDQGFVPPGWMFTPGTTNPGFFGQLQPGPPTNTTFFNSVPDGITVAWSDEAGSIIYQNVGTTTGAGVIYTLTVDIGARADTSNGNFFDGTADLMLGTTVCMATTIPPIPPSPGNWSTYTAQCTSTEAGDPIVIQLNSSGPQGDFDNVHLTDSLNAATTPEPTSFLLMGSGLLAMGGILRRRIFGR